MWLSRGFQQEFNSEKINFTALRYESNYIALGLYPLAISFIKLFGTEANYQGKVKGKVVPVLN
jgi:hypothetical protein